MPHDVTAVIHHAFAILSWLENLSDEDMPPSWMWAFDEELTDWFDAIQAKHKSEMSGDETSEMMKNEV